jgi:hypothetical protein
MRNFNIVIMCVICFFAGLYVCERQHDDDPILQLENGVVKRIDYMGLQYEVDELNN